MELDTDKEKNLQRNLSFFDRWAKSYDYSLFQFWMRKFQTPVFAQLALTKKTRILDVSCGTGELLRKIYLFSTIRSKSNRRKHRECRWVVPYGGDTLTIITSRISKVLNKYRKIKEQDKAYVPSAKAHDKAGNIELYGIDFSAEMLNVARSKLPADVQLQHADIHALPFAKNYFDDVISTEAFHHYYDQQKALREMVRVSKKGGKIMVVDINFFFRTIHWLFETFEPGCVKVNGKKEMWHLFQQAGLRNIQQERTFLFAVMTVGEK